MVSYSFHLSNKGNAIATVGKLKQASKHNTRGYKSEEYSRSEIVLLHGSDNLLADVQQIYHEEFDEALVRYNEKQTRSDRRIDDYLTHVDRSRSDVAAEIIVQVGDKDFGPIKAK